MYHVDDSEFELLTKKEADLEPLFPWTHSAAAPFDYPSAGYSYDAFPREVPMGYELYGEAARPIDAFEFPTELQMGNGHTDEKDSVSAELSSNRTSTQQPSTAQIKNRRAQKKFRERQKAKMTGLAEEVESLRKRVENLSSENRDLENSNMLLSKVIQMRDYQMGDLRTVLTERDKPDNCCLSDSPIKQLPASKDTEQDSTGKRWEISHRLRKEHHLSKFLNMPHNALRNVWKQGVETLAERLVMYETDPKSESVRSEIGDITAQLLEVSMRCATLSPSSMCTLVASGDADHDLPNDKQQLEAFWTRVLVSLKLTPNQERLLLNRRQAFVHHLEAVWKKRAILSDKLQGYVQTRPEAFKSNVWSCRGGTGIRQILDELKDTAFTDCQQHTDFIGGFFCSIVDEIQSARAYVESYPFYPDILQMANLLQKKYYGTDIEDAEDKSQSTSLPSGRTLQS